MISHLSLGFFNIKLCFCFFHNSLLLFTCSLQMCDVALFMGLIFIILLLISWIDVGGHLKVINLKQRLPLWFHIHWFSMSMFDFDIQKSFLLLSWIEMHSPYIDIHETLTSNNWFSMSMLYNFWYFTSHFCLKGTLQENFLVFVFLLKLDATCNHMNRNKHRLM